MTAPTFTNLTTGGASSNTSFNTASISPTGNTLVVLSVHAYISSGSAQPSAPTITGNGITWGSPVHSQDVDTSGTDRATVFTWVGTAASPTAGAIHISFGATSMTRCVWVVDQSDANVDLGSGAAGAVAQHTGLTSASVSSQTVSYTQSLVGSTMYAAFAHQTNVATTPRSLWTEVADATPVSLASLETQYFTGSDTAASATWGTAARTGGIVLEIAAGGGGSPDATATPSVVEAVAAVPLPFLGLPGHISDPTTGVPVEPEAHTNDPAYYVSGALYRVMESSLASGNHPAMMKSSDGGETWSQAGSLATGADLECVTTAIKSDGHTLSVTICPDSNVWYYEFDTSSDTWTIDKEVVDSGLSSSGVAQNCYQVQLSDGTHWIFYSDTLSGTNQQLAYRKRTGTNTYGTKVSGAFAATTVNHGNVKACVGASNLTYVFYDDDTNAHVYMRTLSSTGTLSSATQVDTAGAFAPSHYLCRDVKTRPVYYDDAGVEVISVMWAEATTGNLYLTQFRNGTIQTRQQISTGAVQYNPASTTSDAIAAHISVSGTTVHMVWTDNSTGDILYRSRAVDGTLSSIQTLWSAPDSDSGYYVFCEPFTRSGQLVLGYVYDAGNHGNDISYVDYNELILAQPAASPTVVAGVAAVPAPTVRLSKTATPAMVASVAAIPVPTVPQSGTATPAVVAGVAAVPAPTVQQRMIVTTATGVWDAGDAARSVATNSSPAVGDGLLVLVFCDFSNDPTEVPDGTWDLVVDAGSVSNSRVTFYQATVTTAGVQTISLTGSNDSETAMAVYVLDPAFASVDVTGTATGSGASQAAPSVATSADDELLICGWVEGNFGSANYTATPSGMTQDALLRDSGTFLAALAMHQVIPTAGGTGTKTATGASPSFDWAAASVALSPVSAGGTDATATPSVVSGTAAVPSVTMRTGMLAVVSVVAAVATVLTPTISNGSNATAAPVAATAVTTVASPTMHTGSVVSPAAVASAATIGSVTVASFRYVTSISSNGRYFLDQDDHPMLIRGESPWAMFTKLSSSEMDTYLENRAGYGCNFALVSMIGSVANGGPADTGATYDGVLPFTGGNPTAFNSTYWSRMDSYIAKARDLGITLMIFPMDGWNTTFGSTVFNPGSITNTQCQTYGQTLATRYLSYPNIVWSFGGDYNEDSTIDARFNACLTGIRAAGDTRPCTIQLLYETSESHNSAFWEPKVDWDFIYTYYVTYKGVSDGYNHTWSAAPTVRPAVFSEGAYENSFSPHNGTDEALRRQACWALTSGSPGELTGQEGVWNFEADWATLLDTTAADQMKAIRDTFEALDWWTLVPDDSSQLVTAGRGTRVTTDSATFPVDNNFVTAGRAADGTLAVIFLPNAASAITVDMTKIGANPTATWVDPTNGATTAATVGSTYSKGNNAVGDTDWLLVLTGDAGVTATPSTVTGVGSVPSVTVAGGASVSPAAVTGAAAVPAPIVQLSKTAAPAAVVGAGSVSTPTVQAGSNVLAHPSAVAGVATVPGPGLSTGETVIVTAVAQAATIPTPGLTTDSVVTPATVGRVAVVGSPSISVGGSAAVSPTAVTVTAAVPAPVASTGQTATPAAVARAVVIPIPTATGGTGTTPSVVVGLVAIPVPTVTGTASATASPAAVLGVAVVPTPAIAAGGLVAPAGIVGAVVIPAPTVRLSVAVSVQTVSAVGAVLSPLVVSSAPVAGSATGAVAAVPTATAAYGDVPTATTPGE